MKFIRYTFPDWMAEMRPTGVGVISISGMDEKFQPKGDEKVIAFTEVVCDFCNDEIKPKKEDGTDNDVYMNDCKSYAVCKECATKDE